MIPGAFNIVIGAQAGSESKGKLSAFLARKHKVPIISMTSSPNAGHTVVVGDRKYVTYHLPAAMIGAPDAVIYLGPASLIDVGLLAEELEAAGRDPSSVYMSPRAGLIMQGDKDYEGRQGLSDIGSTLQGVGAARCSKMTRNPEVRYAGDSVELLDLGIRFADTASALNRHIRMGATVLHEMTQGFDLCLEHGIHPRYCTSKMIHPAMAMAEAGVSPRFAGSIYGVLRPYPIRVNNRTGTSGPYTGAKEITWDQVRAEAKAPHPLDEITTTTKLPRRVFTFSWERFEAFVLLCRPTSLCLQFANYIDWRNFGIKDYGALTNGTLAFIRELERVAQCPVQYVGTGPELDEMCEGTGT